MTEEWIIRPARSPADYVACQEAQRLAWGIADESYVVPIATMVGANRHGGLVLGAFRPDGTAAGLSFGFLGRIGDRARIGLYSQLTGIVPECQGKGLGRQLKQAQLDWAVEQGIEVIAWAFDPLQAGNAHFNLDVLGAFGRKYIDNMYGFRTDRLNAGVPTDRLIVEWETAAGSQPQSRSRLRIELPPDPVHRLPQLTGWTEPIDPIVLIELPADIQSLRQEDPAAAEQWRSQVRQGFTQAFAQGYQAVGTLRDKTEGRNRCFYVLNQAV